MNERDTPTEPTPMGLRAAGSSPTTTARGQVGGVPGSPNPGSRPNHGRRACGTAER